MRQRKIEGEQEKDRDKVCASVEKIDWETEGEGKRGKHKDRLM